MSKTAIIVVALLVAFAIIGTSAMEKTTGKDIIYTEDEKAFIKKCSEHRYVSDCKASIIALRELK